MRDTDNDKRQEDRMNSHDLDAVYLYKMYNSFWEKLFGPAEEEKSATGSKKPAEEEKPAETKPATPASSYMKSPRPSMNFARFGTRLSMLHGSTAAALTIYALAYKAFSFASTFFAGFKNNSSDDGGSATEATSYASGAPDPFTTIDCYGDRVY